MSSKPGSPVNVAVVGLGFMGVTHLRAYLGNPLARVVAVCDRSRVPVNGVLEGVAGNIGKSNSIDLGSGVKVYREIGELLQDPAIDLVDICTPTPQHPEQAMAAIRAGKHVLCEKPLARTSAGAREVARVAGEASTVLMPAMCMRFWPGWSLLKRVVAEQTYGKVLSAHFFRRSELPAWSKQWVNGGTTDMGGALFDLHIHDNDFVNHLFGRPAALFSTGCVGKTGTVEHVVTQYQFPGGPAVSAEGSWLLPHGFAMGYQLICERAALDFDLARGADALRLIEPGKDGHVLPCEATDGYVEEIRYALECVRAGKPTSVVTALDAVTALEICEAEEQSIRTGRLVTL